MIWTRTRRGPDEVPAVRRGFSRAGFTQVALHAPGDVRFTVGVHRFRGVPRP